MAAVAAVVALPLLLVDLLLLAVVNLSTGRGREEAPMVGLREDAAVAAATPPVPLLLLASGADIIRLGDKASLFIFPIVDDFAFRSGDAATLAREDEVGL